MKNYRVNINTFVRLELYIEADSEDEAVEPASRFDIRTDEALFVDQHAPRIESVQESKE